ncbi:MAG: mandelate racemase/muconate lactonizing enzyme family protein [Pseudomonadota bacterium]
MKITAIRATPVNIPLEAPYHWSYGALPGFSKTIVEVESDQGVTGIGEAPSPGAAKLIAESFAERLIGRDPIDIAGLERLCVPSSRGVQSVVDFETIGAFGGLDMALWDLRGKLWERPIYDLLGGKVRDRIPFTDYFAYRLSQDGTGGEETAEAVADYCLGLMETHGTTMFEGKVSDPEPAQAIALVAALRERLGDRVMIRIDSNHAYSLATARQLAPAFEELGVRNWEDPVGSYEEMAVLARHTRIPFSSHNLDLPKAVALGAPHAIVGNVAGPGGFAQAARFVGACEAMAVDFWCYSGDSGIGSAAYLQLCAALQWIREPNQSLFRMQPLDVIEEGPFSPRNNVLPVPEGPGLGVTLSQERLAHCHRLFLEDGPMDKYHDPAAPGIFRRLPLS